MSDLISQLDIVLGQYAEALKVLASEVKDSTILTVLRSRDGVENVWQHVHHNTDVPMPVVEQVLRLAQLDQQLKTYAEVIAQCEPVEQWRQSLRPPIDSWWWHFPKPPNRRDRLDWLWNGLTITTLTLNASLATYIVPKFLVNSTGLLSSFAALSPAVLTLLASGGALTAVGKRSIEQLLTTLRLPKYHWQETKLVLSGSLLLALLVFWGQFSRMANWYTQRGNVLFEAGQLIKAQNFYAQAIELSPDYASAHFGMGAVHEVLQQFEDAKTSYLIAAKTGYPNAYNSLARLYLEDGQPNQAIPLLKEAESQINLDEDALPIDVEQTDLYYAVLKNLGWARLQQERLVEAEGWLIEATRVDPDRVEAHCLLAQTLEASDQPKDALLHWEDVIRTATFYEGDDCLGQAQSRFESQF